MSIRTEYHWEYILASFLVSSLGAATALQVIKYRTGSHGIRNWCYLVAASVCLGAIGVWSMHFVGMEAIKLVVEESNTTISVAYSAGLTCASFVVSVFIVGCGFWIAGDPLKSQQTWRYVVAGLAGGIGVATMHYLGMMAMVFEYELEIRWKTEVIAASVIIAITVTTIALFIFFRFKTHWSKDWRVLILASNVMAIAVCSMHYTGMNAVEYQFSPSSTSSSAPNNLASYTSPKDLIIVVITLSIVVCASVLTAMMIGYKTLLVREREHQKEKLILSAIVFNSNDQILLSMTNSLPSVVITDSIPRDFDWNHLDFARIFKAGVLWSELKDYHRELRRLHHEQGLVELKSIELFENFLIAVEKLNAKIGIPSQTMGTPYWKPSLSMICIVYKEQEITTTSFRFDDAGKLTPWFDDYMKQHTKTLALLKRQEIEALTCTHWIADIKHFQKRFNESRTMMMMMVDNHPSTKDDIDNNNRDRWIQWYNALAPELQNQLTSAGFHHRLLQVNTNIADSKEEQSNLFVGFFLTQFSGSGSDAANSTQIMVPSNGPIMIPIIPIGTTYHEHGFSTEQLFWIENQKTATFSSSTNNVHTNLVTEMNFQNDFHQACTLLGKVLGTDKDLIGRNLSANVIRFRERKSYLIVFNVINLSRAFPSQYNPMNLQMIPVSIFESIQASQFSDFKSNSWVRSRLQRFSSNTLNSNNNSINNNTNSNEGIGHHARKRSEHHSVHPFSISIE